MQSVVKSSRNTVLFDFNSMLLHIFCRYCYQLIFSEIFDISFSNEQTYKYYFSREEINILSKMHEEEIVFKKAINSNYDFELSPFLKQYKGELKIDVELINNGSFEKSYYEIKIKNSNKIKIFPFFLNEEGFKKLISEFINKLWISILIQLTNTNINANNRYCLKNIATPLTNFELKHFIKIDENEDLVFDVFHIIYSYYYQKSKPYKALHISTDNILNARGLIQNANSKGYRSGYKNEQRQKIHAALNIINTTNLANIIETKPFHYLFFPNSSFIRKEVKTYPLSLLKYNLKTQLWERRISYYILDKQKEKYKVKDFVNIVGDFSKSLKPMQLRDKLESTLDNLCENKLIKSWHYLKINEENLVGKNWLEKWKELFVICRY